MRRFRLILVHFGLVVIAALLTPPGAALSQGLFSPVVTVNDKAVTAWEVDQRARLLDVFGQSGDLPQLALEQLIEDRLKSELLDRSRLRLSDDGIRRALEDFATRTDMSLEQFLDAIAQNGVAEETLRDYVVMGVSWRDFVRSRFRDSTNVTQADISAAINRQGPGATQVEVLLSEIIIPAPAPRAAEAREAAARISRLTSQSAFSAAAREVSALPSRENGGRLGWVPLDNFPEGLRSVILALGQSEVTDPIDIPDGVALFQLRGVREVARARQPPDALEYAAYYMDGAQSAATRDRAAALRSRVDTCDDLYGAAHDQPPEVLERETMPFDQVPGDVALELAKLDRGEVSTALTRASGQTLVFLMLCDRIPAGAGDIDRESVRSQLESQQLAGFANALLADERAAATIVRY